MKAVGHLEKQEMAASVTKTDQSQVLAGLEPYSVVAAGPKPLHLDVIEAIVVEQRSHRPETLAVAEVGVLESAVEIGEKRNRRLQNLRIARAAKTPRSRTESCKQEVIAIFFEPSFDFGSRFRPRNSISTGLSVVTVRT